MKYSYMLRHGWTSKMLLLRKAARHKRPWIAWGHLYEMSRMCKSIEWEGRKAVAWDWRRRGRDQEQPLNYTRFSRERWKWSKIRLWGWLYNSVHILKTTELYSLKGWTLWYVNYISKLFLNKEGSGDHSGELVQTSLPPEDPTCREMIFAQKESSRQLIQG